MQCSCHHLGPLDSNTGFSYGPITTLLPAQSDDHSSVVLMRGIRRQNAALGRNTVMETISQTGAAKDFPPHRILAPGSQ